MVQRLTDPPQATSRFTVFSMFHPVLDSREIAPADRSPLASADGRRDGEFRRRATARRRARAREYRRFGEAFDDFRRARRRKRGASSFASRSSGGML